MPDTLDPREKQPKPPAPRQPKPGEVLRARPVKGKIDYAEMSREHVARYPKIRARLAE
jgi:hypothetical protein